MLLMFAAAFGIDLNAEIKRAVGAEIESSDCEQGAASSDSIVICGVRRPNRFRIEESVVRSSLSDHVTWAPPNRWLQHQGSGPGSCSPVGPGGYTGCAMRQVQSWRDGGGHLHF
jgi:hypothetical protein